MHVLLVWSKEFQVQALMLPATCPQLGWSTEPGKFRESLYCFMFEAAISSKISQTSMPAWSCRMIFRKNETATCESSLDTINRCKH